MNMSNLKAYKEWKDLFNENIANVWQEESIPLLKRVCMLLVSIKKEIKKIENEVDKDVTNLRKHVIELPKKQDIILDCPSAGISNNKENIDAKNNEIRFSPPKNISKNVTVDSPEMFQNIEAPILEPNDSASIIISDDDTVTTFTKESPEIKKKKKNHASQKRSQRWQRLRNHNTSTMSLLRGLNNRRNGGSCSPQNDGNIKQTSLVDKSSMDFFKELIGHTEQLPLGPISQYDKDNKKYNEQDMALTPIRNYSDVELSIVQCTPVHVSLPKRKDKTSSYLLKKKSKREQNTTLTQMYSGKKSGKFKENKSRLHESGDDSDETCFDPAHCSKTSTTGSLLGITRMVSYLNTNSPLKAKDYTEPRKEAQEVINLDPNTQQIADLFEDIRYEDFEGDSSLNSAIVEENESEEANGPQELNDFLAKAQNVPEYQLEAEPVVRGKARQKLPGWSCKDCEKFYLKQGLKPEEILALNKCSKHRGYYRPREDTLPGFWDMDVRTQDTDNTK